jgi:uncharacterized protein
MSWRTEYFIAMTPVAFHVAGDAALAQSAMLYPSDRARRLGALLVLAHGAGAGQSHPFMVRYARALAERGIDVVTFNFPYMEAGRKSPDRAPVLEAAFGRTIVAAAAQRHVDADRLFIGGKSMGGRMATHLAADPERWPADAPGLDGVVVLGYPLNPPGGSKRSPDRVSHLGRVTVPMLIVQGTRDSFGGPEAIAAAVDSLATPPPVQVHTVDGGDHSFAAPKSKGTAAEIDARVCDAIAAFVGQTIGARATS